MTNRIFRAIMLVAAAVLLLSLLIIMGSMYDHFGGVQEGQLKDELELASAAVEQSGESYLEKLSSQDYRLTWVGPDGAVLYDTRSDAAAMENHADREEIREALETGVGDSERYSSTLLEKTSYHALRLSDGSVLRISVSRVTVGVLIMGMLQPILIVLAVAIVLSAVLAKGIARRVVDPLNRLDLDDPLSNDTYEELSPLLTRLSHQQREIGEQLRRLQRQRDEFAQVTGSMREGLVLTDGRGDVLSINPTAQRLFNAAGDAVGRSFLTVDRSPELSQAIDAALRDGHSELRAERNGRKYQFDISRIESDGSTVGTVLLAFDVTEQEQAEQNRQEFTANVSHELKTPLQSIMGSAELIENGMVKAEDMPRFVGHIRQEASRLVALIEDIIRLSQLDEGETLPTEEVELYELSQEVAETLEEAARSRDVSLSVSGSETAVRGVRRLLYEVVYNLCDNAVKYNVPGGTVDVSVRREGNDALLCVRDSGIGIPPEHQDRVFERFYRVDKSHSKASGGTGLGLSIVKHAVARLGGRIALESEPGRGTEISVTLPMSR